MTRRERRPATAREVKALAHPLRMRILRLCGQQELTNKQLADRLDRDPGTVLYHVRQLVDAGFLGPAPVRSGDSGALEKPYRSTGMSWWLSDSGISDALPESDFPALDVFNEEVREAGPGSIATVSRFMLHLSPADVAELDRRIVELLDEYVDTEDQRLDQPAHGGIVVLHRLADPD